MYTQTSRHECKDTQKQAMLTGFRKRTMSRTSITGNIGPASSALAVANYPPLACASSKYLTHPFGMCASSCADFGNPHLCVCGYVYVWKGKRVRMLCDACYCGTCDGCLRSARRVYHAYPKFGGFNIDSVAAATHWRRCRGLDWLLCGGARA